MHCAHVKENISRKQLNLLHFEKAPSYDMGDNATSNAGPDNDTDISDETKKGTRCHMQSHHNRKQSNRQPRFLVGALYSQPSLSLGRHL